MSIPRTVYLGTHQEIEVGDKVRTEYFGRTWHATVSEVNDAYRSVTIHEGSRGNYTIPSAFVEFVEK